jgi:hypothetical protein
MHQSKIAFVLVTILLLGSCDNANDSISQKTGYSAVSVEISGLTAEFASHVYGQIDTTFKLGELQFRSSILTDSGTVSVNGDSIQFECTYRGWAGEFRMKGKCVVLLDSSKHNIRSLWIEQDSTLWYGHWSDQTHIRANVVDLPYVEHEKNIVVELNGVDALDALKDYEHYVQTTDTHQGNRFMYVRSIVGATDSTKVRIVLERF